jgi:hypothetical protein
MSGWFGSTTSGMLATLQAKRRALEAVAATRAPISR